MPIALPTNQRDALMAVNRVLDDPPLACWITAIVAQQILQRPIDHHRRRCRDDPRLHITVDCGGSNGYRIKLWKVELHMQRRTT